MTGDDCPKCDGTGFRTCIECDGTGVDPHAEEIHGPRCECHDCSIAHEAAMGTFVEAVKKVAGGSVCTTCWGKGQVQVGTGQASDEGGEQWELVDCGDCTDDLEKIAKLRYVRGHVAGVARREPCESWKTYLRGYETGQREGGRYRLCGCGHGFLDHLADGTFRCMMCDCAGHKCDE